MRLIDIIVTITWLFAAISVIRFVAILIIKFRKPVRKDEAVLEHHPLNPDNIGALEFTYKNYKGASGKRRVVPVEIWRGSTKFHPDTQYFLKAFDVDKKEYRDFALRDIKWK